MLPAWMALLGCAETDPEWTTDGPDAPAEQADAGVAVGVRDAPATLPVGASHALVVDVHRGDDAVDGAAITFRSSHPDILSVEPSGRLRARSVGVAWITAESHGATAMVEIEVRED
jgi:hypothetical protein